MTTVLEELLALARKGRCASVQFVAAHDGLDLTIRLVTNDRNGVQVQRFIA